MGVTVLHRDAPAQIVLASASLRRRDLLTLLGISFTVQAANVDESPRPCEGPEALTIRLARSKALAVLANMPSIHSSTAFPDVSHVDVESDRGNAREGSEHRRPVLSDAVVLAADTVVVLGDIILGKPADASEATAMLAALRGRAHRVLTGVALAAAGEIAWTGVVATTVWMRESGAEEVERYVRSGRPLDRAGAYGIQDADFRPVERIEGCLANVVGLPLCEVRRALTSLDPDREWAPGWIAARPGAGTADLAPHRAESHSASTLCQRALEARGMTARMGAPASGSQPQ